MVKVIKKYRVSLVDSQSDLRSALFIGVLCGGLLYFSFSIYRGNIYHDTAHNTAISKVKHTWVSRKTPIPRLNRRAMGVFHDLIGENRLRYIGSALYHGQLCRDISCQISTILLQYKLLSAHMHISISIPLMRYGYVTTSPYTLRTAV